MVRDSGYVRHNSLFTLNRFLTSHDVPCRAVPNNGTVAITEPGSNQFGLIVGHSHVNFYQTELHQSVMGTAAV